MSLQCPVASDSSAHIYLFLYRFKATRMRGIWAPGLAFAADGAGAPRATEGPFLSDGQQVLDSLRSPTAFLLVTASPSSVGDGAGHAELFCSSPSKTRS